MAREDGSLELVDMELTKSDPNADDEFTCGERGEEKDSVLSHIVLHETIVTEGHFVRHFCYTNSYTSIKMYQYVLYTPIGIYKFVSLQIPTYYSESFFRLEYLLMLFVFLLEYLLVGQTSESP